MNKLINNINGWVHSGPQGNDKQIDPVTAGLILYGVGSGIKAIGAHKASKPIDTKAVSPSEIRNYMNPTQNVIGQMQAGYGQMQGIGQQLMDPRSRMNQQQYGMMQEQGANQMALQSILQSRQNAAMRGGGASSGIMRAQQRQGQASLAQSMRGQFQNAMMQNRMAGIGTLQQSQGLLGSIGSMQRGVDENIAQSAIAQRNWDRNELMRQRRAQQANYNAIGEGAQGVGSGMMGGPTEWSDY